MNSKSRHLDASRSRWELHWKSWKAVLQEDGEDQLDRSCGRRRSIAERQGEVDILQTFISVFNHLDAQNLFHNKFYFMPLHVSSTCVHHQGVKIALHSLWYHYTYRYHHTYRCDDTRGRVIQFWPPDDEHMCSKHVEAWNKTYCETNFVYQVG